jgi:hypothetical protein
LKAGDLRHAAVHLGSALSRDPSLEAAYVCLGEFAEAAGLRLLFGPEDWTVEAAAFALCVSAWRFPTQRADVAAAITRRYLHAARAVGRRPSQLHDPLARVLLICPGVDAKVARRARKALIGLR